MRYNSEWASTAVFRIGIAIFFAALPMALAQEELDPDKVKEAIRKGVAWLEKQQQADGSFGGAHSAQNPLGVSSLGLLTLAKCGDENQEKAVLLGFERLQRYPLERTYDVGLILMALESRYLPDHEQMEKSKNTYSTQERKNFQKLSPKNDQKKVEAALAWLLNAQNHVWGYSDKDKTTWHDHSNSQYALLGVGSAFRLGVQADYTRLYRALDHLLAAQEETGPEVEWFSVPAADHSFADIQKLEKDLLKLKLKEEDNLSATVERIQEFTQAGEKATMQARGFSYFSQMTGRGPGGAGLETGPKGSEPKPKEPPKGPGGGPGGGGPGGGPGGGGPGGGPGGGGGPEMNEVTHSMTTAGLAMLVTLKSILENDRVYQKVYSERVNQAIRDSAAWLAHNFKIKAGHTYYYLYGLERAGVLTGCHYFGKHDWYVEAGRWILRQQNADGSWTEEKGPGAMGPPPGAPAGEVDISTTCFALLFLKRATVPLIPELPKRPVTGTGE